ncbi:MAG: glycolate oxidase subunit GlcF [Acidobacteriia bacterium]|nr:glycolate oxidase subunit GlcF [Terriglobia bacterium]
MPPPVLENEVPPVSAFDDHHAPPPDLIDDCVHCGFCLPTCPTYALWGEEMDSPRGRLYLMKMASEGQIGMTDTFVTHIDRCLGCMACVPACPSGVQYDKLIEATRAQIERRYPRSFFERAFRRLIFEIFPYPSRMRLLLIPALIYQKSGLQRISRSIGLTRLMPSSLRTMEALLPELSLKSLRQDGVTHLPAQGPVRRKVGLLTGCVQSIFFAHVNAATARVLAAEGCEVLIPREQGCCGALMVHAGQEEESLKLARRVIDVFDRMEVDTIVINAAGCGSTMKEYGHLLRDDPQYAERARALSAKCKDISEVLAELPARAPRHSISLRVGYHDSCHLQHAQGVRNQPRAVLRTIPGLELIDLPDAAICCGSAGIYNLVEADTARQLGDRKVQHLLSTGAQMVVSGNPGCLLQLRGGLQRAGREMPVVHMIELVDASIRGIPPAAARIDQNK